MKIIISDKISRIIKNKEALEEELNVKLSNRGKELKIEGEAEDEYIAEKVIDAINFGFSIQKATLISKEDLLFEVIPIKNYAKTSNLERVRGRVIGKNGKALGAIATLTECFLEINGNNVGIIGDAEHMQNAHNAIIQIIEGAKHSNVYTGLEKNQIKPLGDLGLRDRE